MAEHSDNDFDRHVQAALAKTVEDLSSCPSELMREYVENNREEMERDIYAMAYLLQEGDIEGLVTFLAEPTEEVEPKRD